MRRLVGAIVLCLAALAVQAAGATAAPTPAWSITAMPFPTNFAPGSTFAPGGGGPAYLVVATNVGGASTSGNFVIVDTLPNGLKPAASKAPFGSYGHQAGESQPALSCSVAGRKITCTGGASPVAPGELVQLIVPVDVEASPPPAVVNRASIEAGGAANTDQTIGVTTISSEPAAFELLEGEAGLFGSTTTDDGSTPTQAGSHPYQETVAGMTFSLDPADAGVGLLPGAGGGVRDIVAELPHGSVVNPGATPVRCTEKQLEEPVGGAGSTGGCPDASQVGIVALSTSLNGVGTGLRPLYNMVPPPGYPASLGFEILEGTYAHLLGSVSADGSFTLSASANDLVAKVGVAGAAVQLWGDPSDSSHDTLRGACSTPFPPPGGCQLANPSHKAFLTLPSTCQGPRVTTVHVDSWIAPASVLTRSYESTDLEGNPVGISGCEALRFEPSISSQPTTRVADSAAGLDFSLHQTQHEGFNELANAPLKDTTVTLPGGMVLNPAAANGREACSTAQMGLASAIGQTPIRWREEPQTCPNSSKLGTLEVVTPLLKDEPVQGVQVPHVVPGAIYLAKPFDNPFGSLLAIYLAIEDEESGILAKLAGKVEPDSVTGQLKTSFSESPPLPLEDVRLHFFGGDRGALTTPLVCGTKTTTGLLSPWSGTPAVGVSSAFDVATAPGGGPCAPSEGQAPNSPGFSAGTTIPVAGAYSPFVLRLARGDGSQRLVSVDTTLPPGMSGKLAGIPYCSEAQIAAAEGRRNPEEGKREQANPSCPAASEVGSVTVGAGSGGSPLFVGGRAYLAGPYKGAALSLAIITPAVAGPFDLGVVVVRVALNVGLETAQIHAVSDPLPTILQGIPLNVRSVAINFNRSDFTLNPTSCEPKLIEATVGSPAGSTAKLKERFGVEGCANLAFKPKLSLSLKGATKRSGHPALKAMVTYPSKGAYANIARAQVGLPHSAFLDQGNLDKVCKQAELRSGTCPPTSIYGHAKAWTPLLDKPLEGPVYLGVGFGYKLPALVADLNGQVRILLKGKVDTTKHEGIRNTFEAVPDAPVSKFILEMKGGKKYGLLENSENICRKTQRAAARFVAQNGRISQLHPKIANDCGKRKKKKQKQHKGKPQKKQQKGGRR